MKTRDWMFRTSGELQEKKEPSPSHPIPSIHPSRKPPPPPSPEFKGTELETELDGQRTKRARLALALANAGLDWAIGLALAGLARMATAALLLPKSPEGGWVGLARWVRSRPPRPPRPRKK